MIYSVVIFCIINLCIIKFITTKFMNICQFNNKLCFKTFSAIVGQKFIWLNKTSLIKNFETSWFELKIFFILNWK